MSDKLESSTRSDPRSQSSREALLVLGMHRSGTSALARLLSLLGAALPEHVVGATRGNEAGHWEPERLVKLHDEMLAEASSRWDDWRQFEPDALGPERLSYYKKAIARTIAEEYDDASLFVLKDPRICRFVPLYEEILGEMDIEPRYILTYRNPVSVLDSLAARDGMASSCASLVWLRHVLDAEAAIRDEARVFCAYEEYLDDWRTSAARISSTLDLDWPRSVDDAGQEIDTHLSRGLQHHAATTELANDQRIGPLVRDAYEALLALSDNENDAAALETLSQIRAEFEPVQQSFVDATFEEMAVRQRREQRDREHLQRLVAKYQGEANKNTAIQARNAVLESKLAQTSIEKAQLEGQVTTLRDEAAVQATEIGRLGAERKALKARHAALDAGRARLIEQNKALKGQNKALEADFAALRNSTSWRLTLPIRAAKRLATDPRNTIAFLRTKLSEKRAHPPASQAAPNSVIEPLPAPKPRERKAPPGLEGRSPAEVAQVEAAFDAGFYLDQYPDVAADGLDPFDHYMRSGWKEGRDPSPSFSTGYYLQRSPEVAKAGINPFAHWVFHGIREKRPALPFHRRLGPLDYTPKVSAIVPNYNHARFLKQRIDSILAQTYENVEVLILDDCSTDDSRDVIERYCEENPNRVRALFNDTNSGNVFRQWRKGIENSTGELVWICESDDFCEPDFLEGLVKHFKDRSVNIAFGRIQFSDREGNFQPGLDRYRELAEPGIWDAPLIRPAQRWFTGGFGIRNVIANVGGCIFRRQTLSEPVLHEAATYSILGDWFLYAHLAGGGQIAYEPSAIAYFRQHGGNTSVTSFVTPTYYEEHERLMTFLRRQWDVADETVEAFHRKVAWEYAHHGLEKKLGPLEAHCDKRKLLAEKRVRPHILIGFLGFHSGGGEVFPIYLANALYEQGHLVSMLAIDMTNVNPEMLATLNPAIPVYDSAWVEEYGADRFLAEAGVSLIHSHMIHLEGFFFEKCRIETKIPYLVTLHGSYEISSLWSNERLLRFALGVSHFVYTADKNLEPFRALPLSEDIFTKMPNAMPVDPRPFPKTRQELGIEEDAVVFTLVARGIQRKGWRAAITAFLRLREAHPRRKMHLLLCGDGVETDRHLTAHGEDPNITFLGYQSRINGLYRLSDVAIAPTRFAGESFPLSLVQALHEGTPIVATRIGEIESIVEGPEGTAGILIEEQRDTNLFIESLQRAMAAMLDASERAKYARVATEKGKTYRMDKVAKDYVALYESMLVERGR